MTPKRSLEPGSWHALAAAIAAAAPFAHPLLMPAVGVPSHLLWFSHVLPVALVTFGLGSRAAVIALSASAALEAYPNCPTYIARRHPAPLSEPEAEPPPARRGIALGA